MGVTFFEALAEGSKPWEILGARNLLIDEEQGNISVVVFCFSPPDCPLYHPRNHRRKVKAFEAPLSALRHLAAGSVWCDGIRLRPRYWIHHTGDIIARKCELILSEGRETTDEIVQKLKNSKSIHLEFLKAINYLRYEHTEKTLYIPCSEIIRTLFAPTEKLLKMVITGTVSELLNSDKFRKPVRLKPSEWRAIELYSASEAGASAARHPSKSIKITHINNVLFKKQTLFLISARLPLSGIYPLWSYGTKTLKSGNLKSDEIITLLEPEPLKQRALKYRARYPKGGDVGPHDLHLSDLGWIIDLSRKASNSFTENNHQTSGEPPGELLSAHTPASLVSTKDTKSPHLDDCQVRQKYVSDYS